jgi:hypothetical protein
MHHHGRGFKDKSTAYPLQPAAATSGTLWTVFRSMSCRISPRRGPHILGATIEEGPAGRAVRGVARLAQLYRHCGPTDQLVQLIEQDPPLSRIGRDVGKAHILSALLRLTPLGMR